MTSAPPVTTGWVEVAGGTSRRGTRSGWLQRTLPATWGAPPGSAASRQGHVQRCDVTNAGRLSPELRPMPFGDHFDGAVDDLDGRLFVDGVGGTPILAAHRSASARVLVGKASRCGFFAQGVPGTRAGVHRTHLATGRALRLFVFTKMAAVPSLEMISGKMEGVLGLLPRIAWRGCTDPRPSAFQAGDIPSCC